jgi:Zn finger protein HypA/HybF involved in hydrogenase expression
MGYIDNVTLLAGIISIIIIITFFVMAYRLKRIMDAIEGLAELEFKKTENRKTIKCEKCENEFTVSIVKKGTINCPKCRTIVRIP